MADFTYEWIKKWNLSKDDFKDLPRGEKALVWALKKGKVDEMAYVHWAKKYYRCPTIHVDFFSQSVKFDLLEKFAGLYSWSSDCYPVNVWKGRLLVACLEPPEKLRNNSKLCFAIAPFSAMDKVWKSYHKKKTSVSVSKNDFNLSSLKEENNVTPKAIDERRKVTQEKTQIASEQDDVTGEHEAQNLYSRKSEQDEETGKYKPQDLSPSKAKTLKRVIQEETKSSPALNQSLAYSKFLITDQDIRKAPDINKCADLKQIISYIFHYLREDYKKLMFVEYEGHGKYFPRFVYGSWQISSFAWKTPVNITDPNIFRIAYKSKLPFHGVIVDNHFNKKYYQLWTGNKRPNFATIYPFYYNQFLYGFLVCFSRTPEFDQNVTLKKIKNLLSLSKTKFVGVYKQSKTSS